MKTMSEIAKLCGVSRQTVHAALNDKPGVSDKTRQHILRIVEEHNYQPNKLATSLLRQSTKLVGVTILNIRNPFFAELMQGINQVLEEAGYHVMLFEPRTKESEIEAVQNMLSYQVAGVIISPIQDETRVSHFRSLSERGTPFVSIGPIRGLESHFVEAESREVGYLPTELLLKMGHRKIIRLEGPRRIVSSAERGLGSVQCLMDHQATFDHSMIIPDLETTDDGYRVSLDILRRPKKDRPTALVCFNDMVAIGVYKAAFELGLSIPDDISVVGCDDIEIARLLAPPLTTIALPIRDMGESAAAILLSQMRNEKSAGFAVKRFQPRLISRSSVKSLV